MNEPTPHEVLEPPGLRLSICICTRDRPDELRQALESCVRSESPVHQIVVSDDGVTDAARELVAASFPTVEHVEGPRKGLSANRNRALAQATGEAILFMDDDCLLAPTFADAIQTCAAAHRDPGLVRTIVTGLERRHGILIDPRDQNFLGFQTRRYPRSTGLNTLVINSAVFPRALFDRVRFDDLLVYGYEEVDFATRAASAGYCIVLCPDAVNVHEPSEIGRPQDRQQSAVLRIYATAKRYGWTEGKPGKAAFYLMLAAVHHVAASLRHEGLRGAPIAIRTLRKSGALLRRFMRKGHPGVGATRRW